MSDNILPGDSQSVVAPKTGEPHKAATNWIIETHSLTKRFNHLTAVDGLTLAVSEGQVFGLLGPNGAGKSTLMKMLVTLLPPTSGDATIAGYELISQPALVRRSIGYVPQLLSADGMLTGAGRLIVVDTAFGGGTWSWTGDPKSSGGGGIVGATHFLATLTA